VEPHTQQRASKDAPGTNCTNSQRAHGLSELGIVISHPTGRSGEWQATRWDRLP